MIDNKTSLYVKNFEIRTVRKLSDDIVRTTLSRPALNKRRKTQLREADINIARRERLTLRDGIPKYFWEFMDSYSLSGKLEEKMIEKIREKGKKMFMKLFHYGKDADVSIEYGPYIIEANPKIPIVKTQPWHVHPDNVIEWIQALSDKYGDIAQRYPHGCALTFKTYGQLRFDYGPTSTGYFVCRVNPAENGFCEYDEHFEKYTKLDLRTITSWLRDLTVEGIEPNPGPDRRRNRNKGKTKRSGRPRPRGRAPSGNVIQYNSIMPSKKIATLKYLDGSTIRNNPGGSFLVYSMRINDLYDPDPAILSGSVSNFKEMMQFYSYYRVLRTSIQWSVSNQENFPLSCGIVFSQTNLTGVIASLADCQNAFENDFVVPLRTISAKGGMDRTIFHLNQLSCSRLLGVGVQYQAESNYSGLGLATPTTPLWANFIVFAPSGAALANGYANNTTMKFTTEFFGRLNVRS